MHVSLLKYHYNLLHNNIIEEEYFEYKARATIIG